MDDKMDKMDKYMVLMSTGSVKTYISGRIKRLHLSELKLNFRWC